MYILLDIFRYYHTYDVIGLSIIILYIRLLYNFVDIRYDTVMTFSKGCPS
jgi:hypothetical protein